MIDLDQNATTAADPRVRAALVELLAAGEAVGNPSSLHARGRRGRAVVEAARRAVAASVAADPLEVVFTSGGTEANNLALLGVCRARAARGLPAGVLTSALEHPSVLAAARALESEGHAVVVLAPDARGRLAESVVAEAIAEHPALGVVALAAANHELGNRYDIPALVHASRRGGGGTQPHFHCDAVQAFGKLALDLRAWDVDTMSVSSHKIHGPAGAGALIVRRGVELAPLLRGGEQERGWRPGTENVLAIHGFGVAAELARAELDERCAHRGRLRERLAAGLAALPGACVHGDADAHSGNTLLVTFAGCPGELVLIALDLAGIAVSTGAACSAGRAVPSAALRACGFDEARAGEAVRFSLGKDNRLDEIEHVLAVLPAILARVRSAAPREERS